MRKLFLVTFIIMILALTSGSVLAKTEVEIWNFSQEQQEFYEDMIEEFEAEHPDIELKWQTFIQNKYKQSLSMALRGESGPDILWLSPEDNAYKFIEHGWIQPIEDYMDEDFVSMYPEKYFAEGMTHFNGDLYSLPMQRPDQRTHGLMFYNLNVFKKAGLDPEKDLPKTHSEFLEVCKKITEAGEGEFYGLATAGKPASNTSRILNGLWAVGTVASADMRFGKVGFDWRDAKFTAANENHAKVVDLLKNIVDNGYVIPGWSSMDKGTARSYFARNKAAFYFDGVWMNSVWNSMGFEDFKYGEDFLFADAPVPDSGRKAYRSMGLQKGKVYLSGYAENTEAAMKVYKWIHDKDYQSAAMEEGFFISANKKADTSTLSDFDQATLEFADEYTVTAPMPISNNSEISKVDWPEIHPDPIEIATSVMQGNMNYKEEVSEWEEKMQKLLEGNINEAQDEGYDVTIEDFKFPNWDPTDKESPIK